MSGDRRVEQRKKKQSPSFFTTQSGFQLKAVVLQSLTQNWQYDNLTLLDVPNNTELNYPLI